MGHLVNHFKCSKMIHEKKFYSSTTMNPQLQNTIMLMAGSAVQILMMVLSKTKISGESKNRSLSEKVLIGMILVYALIFLGIVIFLDFQQSITIVTTYICVTVGGVVGLFLSPKIQEWDVFIWSTALMAVLIQNDLIRNGEPLIILSIAFFLISIYINVTNRQLSKPFTVGASLVHSFSILLIIWYVVGDLSFLYNQTPGAIIGRNPVSMFLVGFLLPTLSTNAVVIGGLLPGKNHGPNEIREHYQILSEKYLHHQTPPANVLLFIAAVSGLVYLNSSLLGLQPSSIVSLIILIGAQIKNHINCHARSTASVIR